MKGPVFPCRERVIQGRGLFGYAVDVHYRSGRKGDSRELAELISLSSGGVVDYLYHGVFPGRSPVRIIADILEDDIYPITYKNAIVAEHKGLIAGMALSFPSRFHGVNPVLASSLPPEQLDHMHDFYLARVDDSWYADALGVHERFRGQGIGKRLMELTEERAREAGYGVVSLIVFADNTPAVNLYCSLGFRVVRRVELAGNDFIHHTGGCLLLSHKLNRHASRMHSHRE